MKRYLIAIVSIFVLSSNVYASGNEICSIKITTGKFNAEKHEYTYWEDSKVITQIDGQDYSGSDGSLPETELRSIVITVGMHRYEVEQAAINNLYNLSCASNDCDYVCEPTKPVVVLTGGDGAGSYAVYYYFNLHSMWVERIIREHPDAKNPEVNYFDLLVSK